MRYMKPDHAAECHACGQNVRMHQTCSPVPACAPKSDCPPMPVMAFVPVQTWDCAYTCGQALARGTLFPSLDKPFMGKGGCCNG